VTGERWIAVGDAATTYDPLSSQGIFKALQSGILASYAICDFFKGTPGGLEKYEALIKQEFDDYLATRADYYGQERRWQASPFWQRRHEPQLAQSRF
jgi:flavin-dependent dehydrogenase